MIQVIKAMAFSFSANIDNLIIGISYGIKNVKIKFKINCIIAILMAFITSVTILIGKAFSHFFDIETITKIGAYSLIAIGCYMIIIEFLKKEKNEEKKEKKYTTKNLTLKEILLIVTTLSINNIATGIAISMTNINITYTFIFTIFFSFFMLYIGNRVGKNFNSNLQRYSNIISAIVIILLGIFQIN